MPKMIDSEKLLKWIEQELQTTPRDFPTSFECGKAEGLREIVKLLDSGTFDPTPPVQPDTLSKLYKCPNCERINIAEAWNYATAAQYGAMGITRIDETGCMDSSFVCPSCGSEEDYGRLEVIK